MTKKRLALLYSGQPRALELCTYNHRKMIIEANPDWDVDIFVHFLFTKEHMNNGYQKYKDNWPKEEKALRQFLQKHWQPKDVLIEKAIINQQFDEDENNPPAWRQEHHKNVLNYRNYRLYHAAMYYGIEMVNTLKKQYEDKHGFVYDCAMRIRSDICFRKPVIIDRYDLNSVYVPFWGTQNWEKDCTACDFFWVASSPVMDKACAVFSHLPAIADADEEPRYAPHMVEWKFMSERLMEIYFKFFIKISVKNSEHGGFLFRQLEKKERRELYRLFYYQHLKRLLFQRHARKPPNPSRSSRNGTMTKKRLALLYSGQPRALELCTYNHRKMIIEANPEWDVDIFVHFLFTQKTKLGDRNKDKWQKGEKDLRQFLQKHWQPKDVLIEKAIINQQFDEDENNPPPWRQEHHKTILNYRQYGGSQYLAAMYYGIEMVNTLKKHYEDKHGFVYDCAMRIRSDICFRKPVIIDSYDLNSVYVPFWSAYHWEKGHITRDYFWVASSPVMDKACAVFSHLPALADATEEPRYAPQIIKYKLIGERLMGIYFKFFAQLPVKDSCSNVALFRQLNEKERRQLYRRFYYEHIIKPLLFKRFARQPRS